MRHFNLSSTYDVGAILVSETACLGTIHKYIIIVAGDWKRRVSTTTQARKRNRDINLFPNDEFWIVGERCERMKIGSITQQHIARLLIEPSWMRYASAASILLLRSGAVTGFTTMNRPIKYPVPDAFPVSKYVHIIHYIPHTPCTFRRYCVIPKSQWLTPFQELERDPTPRGVLGDPC